MFIGPDGQVIGVYHKGWRDPDKDLPVFRTELGTFGICICFDRQLPETCRILRLKGAEAALIPTYGRKDEINRVMMRTRAYENGFFAAFSHPFQSLVTDPAGDVLLDVAGRREGVNCQDIDLSRIRPGVLIRAATRLKLYGPYAKDWGIAKRFGRP